jgi:hypothetical protein
MFNLRIFKSALAVLALVMGFVLAGLPSTGRSANTNFGSIGVGSVPSSTYTYLTGVSEVWDELPLTNILTGANLTTVLAGTAITTGLYIGQVTGLTNNAAVVFPAEVDTGIAAISYTVPHNYRSGGRLVVAAHTGAAITLGQLSLTASVALNSFNSATTTALVAGTALQVPTLAEVRFLTITPTITGATYTPHQAARFLLQKTGSTTTLQLVRAWFVYRPGGVLNGQ